MSSEPLLRSHRPTRVTAFLESLFESHWVEHIRKNSPWDCLQNSWINFSHFTEDLIDKEAFDSLTQEGLFGAYLRGRAIQCKRGQTGVDLVIPMVNLTGKGLQTPVSQSHISVIILQVKNKTKDSSNFTRDFINRAQFDLRHFHGLGTSFYVGIWMSFRSETVDFAIDGPDQPMVFKPAPRGTYHL